MITLSEEKPCVDPDVVLSLHETYAALQDEPKNTLEHTLQYYIDKQYEFDEELRKECPVENNKLEVPEAVQEVSSGAQVM
jgi:hypothetical protein